jgi:hypothetical protein
MGIFTILRKIWYWSYERGSWQYDVMCVAILGFIFLIPARLFDDPEASPRWQGTLKETVVPAENVRDSSLEALSAAVGGAEVFRVQVVRTDDGRVKSYRVWIRVNGR